MQNNKISIVIPIYNTKDYIESCLKSAVSQTYQNIEIICVDDCSPYGEYKVIEKYLKKDSRVKYFRNDRNLHVVKTRNIGIKLASGEYILPLDSDDIIDKKYCEEAIKAFEQRSDISVVYCNAKMFNNDKNWYWNLPDFNAKTMPFSNCVFCSGIFRKKDWFKYGGYSEDMDEGFEDWDFWLNFVKDNKVFYKIPKVLFYYRQVADSRSVKINSEKNKEFRMVQNLVKHHYSLYSWKDYFSYKSLRRSMSFLRFISFLRKK